jgi:hypothetical protein
MGDEKMSGLSYKEFLEAAKARLSGLSAEELRRIILNRASEESPSGREEFLHKLEPNHDPDATQSDLEMLLGEIDAFEQRVSDGYYCTGWAWDDEIFEERDWGDESWAQELDEFFMQARRLLLKGEYKISEDVYRKLFDILEMGREPGHLPGDPNCLNMLQVDIDEHIALFLRSVYMNSAPAGRLSSFWKAMQECRDAFSDVKLKDIINAADTLLPDFDIFLSDLIELLKSQSLRRYMSNSELLREAVVLKGGVAGISEFARQNAHKYPKAYVDWITALEKEGDTDGVIQAAREGLSDIPRDFIARAEVAKALARAGDESGDNALKLEGLRECFHSDPSLEHLLDLYGAAIENDRFAEIRDEVEQRIEELYKDRPSLTVYTCEEQSEEQEESSVSADLFYNALLLSGRYEKVLEMCKGEGPLGWSSSDNPKPIFITFMMVVLSNEGIHAKMLQEQWEAAIGNTGYRRDGARVAKYRRVSAYIIKNYMHLDTEQEEFYLKWCGNEIGRRVDAIVSNKHRGSYNKAAGLLVAMAETLADRGKKQEGNALIERYKKKYSRYSAFRREIAGAIQDSGLMILKK